MTPLPSPRSGATFYRPPISGASGRTPRPQSSGPVWGDQDLHERGGSRSRASHPDSSPSVRTFERFTFERSYSETRCLSGTALIDERSNFSTLDVPTKKMPREKRGAFPNNFPAATYSPTPLGRSTIGPEGLSFRVRNGIGRFPHGMATGKNSQPPSSRVLGERRKQYNNKVWSSLTTD